MACKPICVCLLVTIIAGAIVGGILFAAKSMNKKGVEPSESHKHNYVAALKIAMQFFDIQKSGKLVNNQIKWRGDSGLKDGKEVDLDLSKGMYDAGDAVKFGFPLAFTATMLSWTILERGQRMGMEGVDQLQKAKDSVKWIADYLVNAHPKDNVLYVQVGDAEKDHKCWQRPESITDNKPLFQINTTAPGSDVAAETAAAMASASLVFKKSDPPYSAKLLEHAKKLFIFADKYREYYSVSLPQVKKYYNSTGYGDELLWAASWLYHATQEDIYKDYVVGSEAEEFADWGKPSWFSWDNKLAGVQVLLSRVYFFHGKDNTKLAKYQKSAQALMCTLLPESPSATSDRTNGGLIWIAEWNALQHPVAVAFLASLYGDYMEKSDNEKLECDEKTFKSEDLREFAKKQADYVLGDNPNSMSYLVGYSKKFPKFVHHRGASIPADATTGCKDGYQWLESTKPNPNEATGALVGGPFMNETYIDSRNNSMQGEPTTYNSALLVGLLSSLATSSQSVVTSLG